MGVRVTGFRQAPRSTVSDYERFLRQHPEYADTSALDELRASEYSRLDDQGHAYLDYTGAGLHGDSQVREHVELLNRQVLGNPHSASLCSAEMTTLVERTRRAVLAYFNAAGEYTAVFTLNASGALKLVGESYPFAPGGRCLLTVDNHNSVNGIREFARAKGAVVDYAPLTVPGLNVDRQRLQSLLDPGGGTRPRAFSRFPRSRISPASSIRWT